MAAFMPGASPPLVKTARFLMIFPLLGDLYQNRRRRGLTTVIAVTHRPLPILRRAARKEMNLSLKKLGFAKTGIQQEKN
jgi:hypothetical protein